MQNNPESSGAAKLMEEGNSDNLSENINYNYDNGEDSNSRKCVNPFFTWNYYNSSYISETSTCRKLLIEN